MHLLAQGLRKVKFRWNKVSSWQQRILRAKSLTLVVCFLLPLKGERKTDTCSLFPPFGDPWPSCLLPLTCFRRRLGDSSFCLFLPHLALSGRRGGGAGHRQPVRSCSLVCFFPVGPRNASPGGGLGYTIRVCPLAAATKPGRPHRCTSSFHRDTCDLGRDRGRARWWHLLASQVFCENCSWPLDMF